MIPSMIEINTTEDAPGLVKTILSEAVARQVSDVYLLPEKERILVRWRSGGKQEDVTELQREIGEQCLTHLKVLAGLLTYRTSVAQDGVIRWESPAMEMRVASMPTVFGERLTIRLMGNESSPDYVEDLGFDEQTINLLKDIVLRPHGLIILTGPTGCGKTTTIYAMIRELLRQNQDPASIITLEDPIERIVEGVSQVPVSNDNDEWTYEIALKSALRQDVKTLVVGEMRDRSVVRVVLDAALTGHRVITTYHAGDIPGVYARLLHQGFEPFLISAAISGVVTQRLVPGIDEPQIPVAAVLEPDDSWRDFICRNPGLGELRKQISELPGADIRAKVKQLAADGRITQEQSSLLTAG